MTSPSDDDFYITTYTYCAEIDRFCMQHGNLEDSPEAKEASVKVRLLYDTGVALFSKESIQDVARQLNSKSPVITIRGLDTEPVTFRRESGQTLPDDLEHEWVIGDPYISFMSVQDLCSHAHGYAPGLSLCSMWISHYLNKRKKMTNELISLTPNCSQDGIVEFFQTQREAWIISEHCKELRLLLLAKMTCKVTKIVAFACGGMAFYDRMPCVSRSAYQHALILTLQDVLTELQGPASQIKCYAQDPIYGDLDRKVLDSHGICVLDDAQGFLEVDDSTAVLSFGANIPVRQVVADISRPAMMIWNKCMYIGNEFEDQNSTDPDSPRLTRMLQDHYEDIDFPGNLDAFDDLRIYIKKGTSL